MHAKNFRNKPFSLAASIALLVAAQGTALAYESPVHVFSIDDVMGGFDGSTFGTNGATQDTSIICGVAGGATCPVDNGPFLDKSGVMLYPVDSEFGYYIVDFLGAQPKDRDFDYMEGFVGNIVENGIQMGIQVSNAATDTYKVKPPLGTWCQGLGGTSVKCETEHYTTMEHVLSCHETIPYFFANPVTGEQATLSTPDNSLIYDCDNATLDDNARIISGGVLTATRLVDSTPCEDINDPLGCQMFPNDKTDMQNNIALSTDYSVQLKDDGKPLYGWGGMHKRPNDIRLYTYLELPEEWKEPNADFIVTKAQLVINHWITNNPNDQLRPEDLENEAATGRKPSYKIEGTQGTSTEVWKTTIPCYEGDGDLIDTEEGANDPTFIGVGTVLKNTRFALDPAAEPGILSAEDPYAFSSDLKEGNTNAFYTTTNRDPFEWSYRPNNSATDTFSFIGCAGPADDPAYAGTCEDDMDNPYTDVANLTLVSGPRWRLKPNKFGQDLPGLEIPLEECSPPPFQNDNIKYVVGTPTTTVINLLDWADENSPLATSKGWVDVTANEFVEVAEEVNGIPVTTNGLPMTDDLDLAVYVKGDRKSTAIYNAKLVIAYEGETPTGPVSLSVDDMTVDENAGTVTLTIELNQPGSDTVTVQYATKPGSALPGQDYRGLSGVATFSPGVTTQTVVVKIINDLVEEDEESFTFELSGPVNSAIADGVATVTINDDDATGGPVTLSVQDLTISESVGTASVAVNLSSSSSDTVTVKFATKAGSALPGSDFYGKSGVLTFNPGVTTQTIPVKIINDLVSEPTESFIVRIYTPVNATIADDQGTVTITDND